MALLRAVWCEYAGLLGRRPYTTSSATGGLVMLSGDWLAQRYEHHSALERGQHGHDYTSDSSRTSSRASGGREGEYDKIRAAVMVGFSMGAFMPVNTLWYRNVVERCDRVISVQAAPWAVPPLTVCCCSRPCCAMFILPEPFQISRNTGSHFHLVLLPFATCRFLPAELSQKRSVHPRTHASTHGPAPA